MVTPSNGTMPNLLYQSTGLDSKGKLSRYRTRDIRDFLENLVFVASVASLENELEEQRALTKLEFSFVTSQFLYAPVSTVRGSFGTWQEVNAS